MNLNTLTNEEKLEKILPLVEKPARYIGEEPGSIIKNPDEKALRFAFCFPDVYEIGMSYLGMQILYNALNHTDYCYCERCFAPKQDMIEAMKRENLPLFTLETKTSLSKMDMIGFTLQYELSYTNVLLMLDLSGLSLLSKDRKEEDPIIVAGGPCAFNIEPMTDFFDVVLIGDGELQLKKLVKLDYERKIQGFSKKEFLEKASQIEGCYIPSFYDKELKRINENAPEKITKAIISDLNEAEFPEVNIVPLIEVVHDRSVVEIMRGCSRGCRFCQAGMLYRPVRQRSKEKIEELAKKQLKSSGNSELSLLSLSTSDHTEFEPLVLNLMKDCTKQQISLSLPSLRLDNFAFKIMDEMQGIRKTGLTFAPEAGTQRLRDVINKNITEEEIFTAIDKALDLGWSSVKLYFMIGLPTESYEDLDGIADISAKIMQLAYSKKKRLSISVSVANFVPKPFTPFQWVCQNTEEEFEKKHKYLADKMRKIKGVTFHYHTSYTSRLEAIFARGGRELNALLLKAYENGCIFDAWTEYFNKDGWDKALKACNIDDNYAALTGLSLESPLPWDIIDCGVSKEFLKKEYEKSQKAETTKDCRYGCNACGINRYTKCDWGGIYE